MLKWLRQAQALTGINLRLSDLSKSQYTLKISLKLRRSKLSRCNWSRCLQNQRVQSQCNYWLSLLCWSYLSVSVLPAALLESASGSGEEH